MAEAGSFSHVVTTCQQAWKITRNPMAFLLPVVWQAWSLAGMPENVIDDPMPATQFVNGVPGYSLDQFTRTGNQISRAYIAGDKQLQQILAQTGIHKAAWNRTFGDILFLIEGGAVANRMHWHQAKILRQPNRWLPGVATCGQHLPIILRHCQANFYNIVCTRASILDRHGFISKNLPLHTR